MLFLLQVGVSHDRDLGKVEKVGKEVASRVLREVDGGTADYEPVVRYHTFGVSGINLNVVLPVEE